MLGDLNTNILRGVFALTPCRLQLMDWITIQDHCLLNMDNPAQTGPFVQTSLIDLTFASCEIHNRISYFIHRTNLTPTIIQLYSSPPFSRWNHPITCSYAGIWQILLSKNSHLPCPPSIKLSRTCSLIQFRIHLPGFSILLALIAPGGTQDVSLFWPSNESSSAILDLYTQEMIGLNTSITLQSFADK